MPDDDAGAAPPDWTNRLQSLVDRTIERSSASTASFERLLVAGAAPGVDPQQWANEVARQSGEHGAEAYRELTEITTRFTSESLRLVARHVDDYLHELVPPGEAPRVGSPPPMPIPPTSTDALAWTSWYQRYAAWVPEQQAWSSRLLAILRDEVAAGRVRPDTMQVSARRYLERRLPDYLIAMAELNADLVSDVLGIADDALERLADALFDTGEATVVNVRGDAGTAVTVSLVVENGREETAVISCHAEPVDGFALTSTPRTFTLEPEQSRRVSIRVALPAVATDGEADAGTVTIRGQEDRDLVVWIRATVDPPHDAPALVPPVTVEPEMPAPPPDPRAAPPEPPMTSADDAAAPAPPPPDDDRPPTD
jgi:hypothetical protein